MKYCSECGNRVAFERAAHGMLPRFVCTVCSTIFHQSPKLAAGCIARQDGRILLCRRAVPPGYAQWELPAGFIATGESATVTAAREVLEEANVRVEIERLYAILHIPRINQVRLIYLARLLDNGFKPGPETLEARLFDEAQIPWDSLAFATTRDTLNHYFQHRADDTDGVFYADILPFEPWASE
jgi:ADP-ribose pyrophosphatase YjhB (NUDIX family)